METYLGGKSGDGTYQTIINRIPPHRVYVELFGGGLGIYRHKLPAKSASIIMEQDRALVPFYKSLGLHVVDYSYEDDVERRNRLYLSETAYTSKMAFMADTIELLNSNLFNHHRIFDQSDVFIYADPPYPHSSRKSRTRYKYELTDQQHKDLLDFLTRLNYANIAVSTYPNELYTDHFWEYQWPREWHVHEFESLTRSGKKATEQLWMNYPPPTALHDYRYLGEDYRERERISRMQKRWVLKFQDLPPLEKNAMLARLAAEAPL